MISKIVTAFVVIFLSTLAMGQQGNPYNTPQDVIDHPPTAQQCKTDIAAWKQESKEDIVALPVDTLSYRAQSLRECERVLLNAHDRDGVEWTWTMQTAYERHIIDREVAFLERHNLSHQFHVEDAKGAR